VYINIMVEYTTGSLDRTFHALAHPIRRAILARLAERGATVLEIANQFDISLNGVSKHLKVLEHAGLIRRDIHGRTHHCSLEATQLREAGAWIDYYRPYWERRLDALERFLTEQGEDA
jgi:DNA-binding transcriptional ArsR family regulator